MPSPCDLAGAVPGVGPTAKTACNVVANPVGAAGDAVSSAVGAAADSAFGKVAESTGQAAGDMLRTSMTWWVKSDSINLDPTAIADVQRPLQGVFVLIMMAGILGTAIVMAMSRRGQPAAELLMGAFKYVAITSLSLVVLQGALSAGDDVAKQLVNNSDKFGDSLAQLIGIQTLTNPVMVFLLGVLCFLLALVQWIFGFHPPGGDSCVGQHDRFRRRRSVVVVGSAVVSPDRLLDRRPGLVQADGRDDLQHRVQVHGHGQRPLYRGDRGDGDRPRGDRVALDDEVLLLRR